MNFRNIFKKLKPKAKFSASSKTKKITPVLKRKHEWGAEKNTTPLSMLHAKPSVTKLAFSRISIFLTVFFWIVYIFSIIIRQVIYGPGNYNFTMEAFFYAFVVSMLIFSSLMYLIARHGALERFSKHARVPRSILDKYFSKNQPAITVLVPSYKEEYSVIRKTLLSASLQEYPNLRVVLLIDDNPHPTNPKDLELLNKTRKIGKEINSLMSVPYDRFRLALKRFNALSLSNKHVSKDEVLKLSREYDWAAEWLNSLAKKEEVEDHVDVFFNEQVLGGLAHDLSKISEALKLSLKDGHKPSKARMKQLYSRLVWIFKSNVKTFERKQYVSLSHEANKAMNLNSYIGLMGGTYMKERTENGVAMVPTRKTGAGVITIPDSEFLLTLDADSILLREYCLRLVYFLKSPENANVAVTQTPYSSFRGAFSRIERLAGATTDIQHILHQGMTRYNATFWVGANAVIRKNALEDIVEKERIGGYEVKRYIQDRTVIEDTESSIDLAVHKWQLVNYPERLSYSATPPDFGSLVVQRRRWANGGLIILPKLLAQSQGRTRVEILLRLNYLASIAWATFGLMFLLAYPYDGRLLSPLVLLASLPYFLTMASDLKYCGYKYSDIFRIYGFNLIMLPVNLAGVVKSVEQAITNTKIPFARTPKVKNRTAAGLMYVIVPLLIVSFSVFTFWRNINIPNWGNAAFAAFNAVTATYAIFAYIGLGNLLEDTWMGLTNWIYVEDKPKTEVKKTEESQDWKAVLS